MCVLYMLHTFMLFNNIKGAPNLYIYFMEYARVGKRARKCVANRAANKIWGAKNAHLRIFALKRARNIIVYIAKRFICARAWRTMVLSYVVHRALGWFLEGRVHGWASMKRALVAQKAKNIEMAK